MNNQYNVNVPMINLSEVANFEGSTIDDSILKTIASSKKRLVFSQLMKTKKNVIENLRCDNFPRPLIRNIKVLDDNNDSARTLTTAIETPEGISNISSPKMISYNKQKIINQQLENWAQVEEKSCSKTSKSSNNVNECKATYTELAFDLRNYNDAHGNCSHSHNIVNHLFMERVAIFRQKMIKCCKKSMLEVFDVLFEQLLEMLTSDCKNYKLYKFEPFADAILLIISNAINMPINVF